jgi:hypothetical protein
MSDTTRSKSAQHIERLYTEVHNAHCLDRMPEFCAPDILDHGGEGERESTPCAIRRGSCSCLREPLPGLVRSTLPLEAMPGGPAPSGEVRYAALRRQAEDDRWAAAAGMTRLGRSRASRCGASHAVRDFADPEIR